MLKNLKLNQYSTTLTNIDKMDELVCETEQEVLEAINAKKKFVLASKIVELNWYFMTLGSSGAAALSDSLKSNSTLATLNLSRNWIRAPGASALSDSLKSNSTIPTLILSTNSIGAEGTQHSCLLEIQ